MVDRQPVHRSKAPPAWLTENAERIEVHLMPGYSPELNPVELLNADLKHHVNAARATSLDDLAAKPAGSCAADSASLTSSAAASEPDTSDTQSSRNPISSNSIFTAVKFWCSSYRCCLFCHVRHVILHRPIGQDRVAPFG
ncbi:transposase [Streptomyces sp. NPDC088246]|uniref:transposase n=1 Tax=Streptomyces sp. NPDC088246 TaxID=3365842 RepID=UPI00382C0384